MKTILLKTNLKCNGCIAAVKPALDSIEGLDKWEVDLTTADKVLKAEVTTDAVTEKIIEAFKIKGYEATPDK